MSGSMSGVWRRGHGRTSEAPPDERGGNRYVRPTTTAHTSTLPGTAVQASVRLPPVGVESGLFGVKPSTAGQRPSRPFRFLEPIAKPNIGLLR